MTFISQLGYVPNIKKKIKGPKELRPQDISIVIPVKNNQVGIEVLLNAFFSTQEARYYPKEIIIVDDAEPEIIIPSCYCRYKLPISVIHCYKTGPAAARNMGWKQAQGEWILFTDSDCIPQKEWITGYMESINGSIGYAGNLKSHGSDLISKYYESQKILIPPPFSYRGAVYPEFLVTANALVWKCALEEINGFDEDILIAAGEDVDLGFRLREIGDISYALDSVTYHNFDDGIKGFIKRFKRYGEGNRRISKLYNLALKPRPFNPVHYSIPNYLLSKLQYYCLSKGYSK